MAYERPNKFVEWYEAVREHAPAMRRAVKDWWGQVREEPWLIWETPAIRYATYGIGGLLIVWSVTFAIGLLTPPLPPNARPEATTADFHVICTDSSCHHHFVINRDFGFDDFPVACPKCGKETGMAARMCNSPTCRGRWVTPVDADGKRKCPECGAVFP